MDPNKTSEALTQGLQFTLLHNDFQGSQEDTFKAFDLVAKGRVVEFNEFLFRLDQRFKIPAGTTELPNKLFLLKRADDEEKNLLFYAVHYNYHNLILYLLDYGIDPFHKDLLGRTVFHTIGYKGLLEACEIILNYQRYLHRMRLFKVLKAIKSSYAIKKSDIVFGEPSGPDAHLPSFQHRFTGFLQELAESYEDYCHRVYQDHFTILTMEDNLQRNPLHWAGLAKFTKCARVMKTLLDPYALGGFPDFERLWGEVENLKLVKDPLSDPKIYQEIENDVERFLLPRVFKAINGKFEAKLAQLQKQVINKGDSRGLTPLHLASFSSQHELCQYLVNLGADKFLKDTLSKTALNYSSNSKVRKAFTNLVDAALEGDLYSFEYLLHSGCDINERKGISAIAPIHNAVIYASRKKDIGFLSIVIKSGADVNLPDINGWTSLHHACKEGMREVVDFLIKSKADLNKISATGLYPLHIASLNNCVDVIDYLYEKKVYMDVKDQDGMTPFLLAAKKNNLEALKRLLRYGAWLYAVDKFKWNAMHHASYLGHKRIVHFLACADSDEDRLRRMANSQDKTPFKLAHDEDTRSAMNSVWFAARSGKLDIVRRLHTLGDDINEPSPKDKRTPLMLACMEGHLLVAKYLMDHHADEKLVDRFERTASYYARQKIIDPKTKREIDNPVRSLFV